MGDAQSSLTSLASSIVKGVEENGRTYATYGKEGSPMPLLEVISLSTHVLFRIWNANG